ncbi:DUF5710 domain-containing protein [Acidovorax sp. Be4]|uniref:DUF5710 domain-containing protein n=1 Tax=Acidovorax bellezanensis TaxID=2976702 RepID=A0ABT2PMJ9_9BURK|nr:DUF5710 domain-containing protein [Acidovorax sp. Be4]MCT9811054.1 DUF5710 domain-containing protein [Acidovorax sp. Be4]
MNKVQLQLNVPFASKDQAKGLGARWNPEARSWYVPHGLDIQLFKLWWPEGLEQPGSDAGAAPSSTALPRAKPAPKAVPPKPAGPAVFTGPQSVAQDHSDKLPWED